MGNAVVASYVATSIIFLGTGILLISIAAVWQKELMDKPTMESVARYLLLKKAPLSGKLHLQPFRNVRGTGTMVLGFVANQFVGLVSQLLSQMVLWLLSLSYSLYLLSLYRLHEHGSRPTAGW